MESSVLSQTENAQIETAAANPGTCKSLCITSVLAQYSLCDYSESELSVCQIPGITVADYLKSFIEKSLIKFF